VQETAAKQRETYHHGNLREALIEATLHLVEEGGPDRVTVRAAALRAGVSSGAPFRHFPNKVALMTAVAEQATRRLHDAVMAAVAEAADEDPLRRFRTIGTTYLRWACRNPTHFQIVSTRSLIDYESSESMSRDNDAMRAVMDEVLAEAQRDGLLRPGDLGHVPLAARGLAYGLARMYVDGHFAQWHVGAEAAERSMHAALDVLIDGLTR
jgi:AcrR family transcriptional regulator